MGGITPLTQGPVQVMGRDIDSVSAGGLCTISINKVKFDRETEIQSNAVAKKAGMNKGSVKFCCSESVGKHCKGHVFPDESFSCKEEGNKLEINQDALDNIRSCCPIAEGEPCTIGFE